MVSLPDSVQEKMEEKETLKEQFKKAGDTEAQKLKSLDSAIKAQKRKVFPVEVQCPHCSKIQQCETIKQRKCSACGRSFTVMPKTEHSRLTNSESNRKGVLDIQLLFSLEINKKYPRF